MKWILFAVVLLVLSWVKSAKACDGYYQTRYETVCVCAAHYEPVWVSAPAYSSCGVLVRSGYYAQVYAPARYATRAVSVWVAAAQSYAYAPVYSGPYVGGSPNYLTPGYRRW